MINTFIFLTLFELILLNCGGECQHITEEFWGILKPDAGRRRGHRQSEQFSVSLDPQSRHITVPNDENLTALCRASSPSIHFTSRVRFVLTFAPRTLQYHQISANGIQCNPSYTKCIAHFNIPVLCITNRISVNTPVAVIEFACQLADENICSSNAVSEKCHDIGEVTIVTRSQHGEPCNAIHSHINTCLNGMFCDYDKKKCVCLDTYGPIQDQNNSTICVPISDYYTPDKSSDSILPLPTLPSLDNHYTHTPEVSLSVSRGGSKVLWIFLAVIIVLLIAALIVFAVIWRRTRMASMDVTH